MIQDLWALQVAGPQKADICCIIHLREFVPLSLSLFLSDSKWGFDSLKRWVGAGRICW